MRRSAYVFVVREQLYVRHLDALAVIFAAVLYKGDNFSDFLFVLLYTKPLSEKGSTLKAPGANSFLLE